MPGISPSPSDEWRDREHPVPEDMAMQRRTWRIQRVGWAAMALVLLAALLGLFAEGPLSDTTLRSGDGRLEIEYPRFLRNGATSQMTLRFATGTAGTADVLLGPAIPRKLAFESIRPAPVASRTTFEGLILTFELGPEGRGKVNLSIRPNAPGFVAGPVGLAGAGAPPRISAFVYP